jgi:hypothetical protein
MPSHALKLASKAGGERWQNGALDELIPTLPHCKSGTIPVRFTYQDECAQALIRAGNGESLGHEPPTGVDRCSGQIDR